ncbi:MAG: COG4315 family predicted lipoprotein [Nocardioidaceae bacterium]
MITSAGRRLATGARLVGAVLAATLLVAACGSSSPGAGTSSTGGAASGGGGASSSGATVATHSGAAGTFLTDGSGKSLYMFASDTSKKSNCSGACTTYWPPLTTSGTPKASGGATSGMLGTVTRSDGTKQVTYNGHPLYFYAADSSAGDTNGQGSSNFGAKWWLMAPSGQPITSSGGGSSTPTTSGGGGGWS